MPGKIARSPDRTSSGAVGTPGALRSLPAASREPRRLLEFTPFQTFIWGMPAHYSLDSVARLLLQLGVARVFIELSHE